MTNIMRIWTFSVFGVVLITPLTWAGDRDKHKSKDKPTRPTPTASEQIEQLLQVLRNDRKDDHRAKAAEELGKLASPDHPEIVAALIDALVRDDSSSARKAVVRALGDIEPPTHEVKDVLEQAVKQDRSWLVRQSARLAVWRYKPKDEPPSIPGPKLRNTSKPTPSGKLTVTPKAKPMPATDPLKSAQPPLPVLPIVPSTDPPAPPLPPGPVRLTAPRPGGE